MLPPPSQFLREDAIRGGMDLLLFANVHHLRRADEKLAELGLGRAHHRVLYFVGRRPDMAVSELLTVLAVTKQSLGRVTKDLARKELIEQHPSTYDRRRRLLRLTPAGAELERALFDDLHDNVARAYSAAGGEADSVLFLHADHVVRAGPDGGDTVVFSDDSAAWKIFCRERLHFDQARESLLDTTGQ